MFSAVFKTKGSKAWLSCNHQEESSESSESSDSRVRSNVTSASSANTSNKQAVLGAHSRRSVGARRCQLCFRWAVAVISWLASIISLMRCEVKLLIRSNTEGSTVCATLWHYGWCFLLEIWCCARPSKLFGDAKTTAAKLCGFFFLDLLAGTVRSGEKWGQKWSEVVRSKPNKLWNVMTLS